MPTDFKEFLSTFGTGRIGKLVWILNPGSINEHLNLLPKSEVCLRALRTVVELDEGEAEAIANVGLDNLLPFGITDNGDVLYWTKKGTPDEWHVAVNEARSPEWEFFELGMAEFLGSWLEGTLQSKILGDPDKALLFESRS